MNMRKRFKVLTVLCVVLLRLGGCASKTEADDRKILWIITELSNSDGMNYQAEMITERLEEENPGLTVLVEILPTGEEERELRLTQLRTQIMSGNGPDVYLLPTGSELISDEPQQDDNIPVEPLFADVQQAIRNGIFLDVSGYYDSDTDLGTDALNQTVMDAGCFDGKRYVLPLRYNIPVIYTQPELCKEYGLSQDIFSADFLTVAQTVLALENADTAAVGLKFPEIIEVLGLGADYKTGTIRLAPGLLRDYLHLHQLRNEISSQTTKSVYDAADYYRMELYFSDREPEFPRTMEAYEEKAGDFTWPKVGKIKHEDFNLLSEYTYQMYHWSTNGMPVYTGHLSDILETIGVTIITGQKVEVYPIRALDGSVQASISYWGALGSSCKNPDLAYSFLRQFLTEEFQWDIYRPRANKDGSYWTWQHDPQFKRMVEDSLPVRTKGCVEPLWDNLQYQVKLAFTTWVRKTVRNAGTIQRTEVTTQEVPYLNWDIDQVYFPIHVEPTASLKYAMHLLNEGNAASTGYDVDALAQDIYQALWWHLAEG